MSSVRCTFAVAGFVLLVPICRLPARCPRTDAGVIEPVYALAWKRLLGGPVSLPAVGSDGTVYVGSKEGDLYALRASDRGILWRHSTGVEVRATPCPTGDLWRFKTHGPIRARPAVRGKGGYFGSDVGGHRGRGVGAPEKMRLEAGG